MSPTRDWLADVETSVVPIESVAPPPMIEVDGELVPLECGEGVNGGRFSYFRPPRHPPAHYNPAPKFGLRVVPLVSARARAAILAFHSAISGWVEAQYAAGLHLPMRADGGAGT